MKGFAACAAVALAAAIVAASAAAGTGNGNAKKSATGAQTGHFTATYANGVGGTFTCTGEHVAKPGPNGFVRDEEECTISDGASFFPAGKDVGSPYYTFKGVKWYWFSDFNGVYATSVTYIVSPTQPDGSAHLKIIAYY
jgi:hypothetical protein